MSKTNKIKLLKSKRFNGIAIASALGLTSLAAAAAATVMTTSHAVKANNKVNLTSTEDNAATYVKVEFLPGSGYESAKFSGQTIVKVKSGMPWATVTKPTATLEGSAFDGWYKDPTCTQPWSASDLVTSVTQAYAKFTQTLYMVHFQRTDIPGVQGSVSYSGPADVEFTPGQTFGKINIPVPTYTYAATEQNILVHTGWQAMIGGQMVDITQGTELSTIEQDGKIYPKYTLLGAQINGSTTPVFVDPTVKNQYTLELDHDIGVKGTDYSITWTLTGEGFTPASTIDQSGVVLLGAADVNKTLTITATVTKDAKTTVATLGINVQPTPVISVLIVGPDTVSVGQENVPYKVYFNGEEAKAQDYDWTVDDEYATMSDGLLTIKGLENSNLTLRAQKKNSELYDEISINIQSPVIGSTDYFYKDSGDQHWIRLNKDTVESANDITAYDLNTHEEITAITRAAFNTTVYIGDKVAAIGDNFLADCTAFTGGIVFPTVDPQSSTKLVYIGDNFMSGCANFVGWSATDAQPFKIPDTVEVIGDAFLEGCEKFVGANAEDPTGPTFTIPSKIEIIGDNFMDACIAWNSRMSIPNTAKYIGKDFMYNCTSFESTINIDCEAYAFVPCDTTLSILNKGTPTKQITISGSKADDFMKTFPNLPDAEITTDLYRNLVKA